MSTADLTLKKKKGKALVAAVGKAFAPEYILEKNRTLSKGKPSAGFNIGGKK